MEQQLQPRETGVAIIRYTSKDRVVVQFKQGVTLTVENIAEMMQARAELGRSGPHKVLMILADPVEFDIAMITTDHYKIHPQPNTEAVAWLAHNATDLKFTKMFLSYFAPAFPSEAFMDEEEALRWLGWKE